MHQTLPWMVRADPSYDPNLIGAISQVKVMAALVEAGKVILTPCVNVARYDLVIEEEGKFYRVQCKTGRLIRGAVRFPTFSLRAAKRETGWERWALDYAGEVDFFGVYCPDNGLVYLVPITDVFPRGCALRVTPAANNQNKRIRWAKDYVVVPLHEVYGSVDGLSSVR